MSRLQILIPQYNETDEIIKPLLDSISIQQSINLKKDIEVFIGNDGSDTKLSIDFLKTYNFPIQYHYFEHGGLAATRQKLHHLATADYIMFCDADDCFISTIALNLILSISASNCDVINCDFLEEHYINNSYVYIPHHEDAVFVHGKIYRRKFLEEQHIEWNSTLHEHQDSAFNVLAISLSKNTKVCAMPVYMWHDNPISISRKNGKYHAPNTWPAMLDSYCSLIDDFTKRGYGNHARYYAAWALYATYWEMSHDVWKQDDIVEQKKKVYDRLVKFYHKYQLLIENCDEKLIDDIQKKTEELAKRKGKLNEMPPFDEWLEAILKIFK